MDSISNARISMALTSHRDVMPARTADKADSVEATRVETDAPERQEAVRQDATGETAREEYRRKLDEDKDLAQDFQQAFHKLNERPIFLPQTIQETDQQVQQEDLDVNLERDQLQGRLELAQRQMEEIGPDWDSRTQMLSRSRSAIEDHLGSLGSLMDRYHEKFQDFVGNPKGSKAQHEIGERMARLEAQRSFLENYYEALGGIAGREDGANTLTSLSSRAELVDPSLAHHPEELARRRRQEREAA